MQTARLAKFFRGVWLALFLGAAATVMGRPLDVEKLREADAAIVGAIAEHKLPGAVLWIEHGGDVYWQAYGNRSLVPNVEAMTRDTIFDAASLTKVVATTPAAMILWERGKLGLDESIHTYLREITGEKEKITVRMLLTHTSGQAPDVETKTKWTGAATAIAMANGMALRTTPGTAFRYSDINYFLLGEIVARVSGMPLQDFCAKEIYGPLGMADTGFLPDASKRDRIAPTEMTEGVMLRGVVHDPTARYMGGVAGHAGLFTTARDLARYARMMLNGGELEGARILKAETVKMMTSVQTPAGMADKRGFGWDIDSGFSGARGNVFPIGSYGHTGFTGNALWIDPYSRTFYVFLSNRVHPDGKGNVLKLYRTVGTLAAEAAGEVSITGNRENGGTGKEARPGVLEGIDVLERGNFAALKGLKIGLITNPTGVDAARNTTIDLLRNAPGVELKALFGPEHGLYGNFDEAVKDGVDAKTGMKVYSLYGERRAPTAEEMAGLDALVFDIQDVGCRFYTYTATLGLAMEAANRAGLKFFALDRVDPITGSRVDGPVLSGKTGFVGYHPVPVRTGMTLGELAGMYKAERGLEGLDLTVVKVEGWKRRMWFDETGQPWINPSPNMRSVTEAALYPGVGLLESCRVSVGRGTGTPFEVIGAPYIDDVRFAAALNGAGIEGVRFVPVRFTPTEDVYKGTNCGGVNIVLTDRNKCRVVDIGMAAAEILNLWYPKEFELGRMSRLLGDEATLEALRADKPLGEIRKQWKKGLKEFEKRRKKFLLYK